MAQSQARFITANGLNFHLLDWGGQGQWIVGLHGLASQAHIWDLVAPRLIDSFRVMAIDQRGYGLSDKPDHGYDFTTMTSDLDAILQAQHASRDRAVLAGHSWGGNVALQYAVDYPDRVSGLILIDGGFLQVGDRFDWPTTEKFLEPPDLIEPAMLSAPSGSRCDGLTYEQVPTSRTVAPSVVYATFLYAETPMGAPRCGGRCAAVPGGRGELYPCAS